MNEQTRAPANAPSLLDYVAGAEKAFLSGRRHREGAKEAGGLSLGCNIQLPREHAGTIRPDEAGFVHRADTAQDVIRVIREAGLLPAQGRAAPVS